MIAARRARSFALLTLLALIACDAGAPAAPPSSFQRGVALGLFASDPDWDYDGMLAELRALGATDVSLAVPWQQTTLDATVIAPWPGSSPSSATLRRTIRQAHRRGLRVLVFPLIQVGARTAGDWRGLIEPRDPLLADAWWSSYGAFVGELAAAAQAEGAERLSVGSELLGLEEKRPRWQILIASVRRVFTGKLLYSANWDHFNAVRFWDLVDEVGVTGYFELTRLDSPALEDLVEAWSERTVLLQRFAERIGRPLTLTEVGYPSLAGANRQPWDYTRQAALDLEEQQRCYTAFCSTLGRARFLDGVYFWNWFGVGGPRDTGYTPRGKPAARVLGRYFELAR